jgi:hypothetical protein
MDKVLNLYSPDYNTPSSEPFRIDFYNWYGPGIYPSFRKPECMKIQLAKTLNHISFLMKCKCQGIVPISLNSSKIAQHARRALLRDRIYFHWHNKAGNKASQVQKFQQLENFLRSSVSHLDQQRIFTAVDSSFTNMFRKQRMIHIEKFSLLNSQQNKVWSTSASDSKIFVLNLSKHALTDSEETVHRKGLNFAVAKPHYNLDM